MKKKNHLRYIISSNCSTHSVVSYGLSVYAYKTKRWLVVQRKHSAEFLLFMKGYYRPSMLWNLFSETTGEEKDIVRKYLKLFNPDRYGGENVNENVNENGGVEEGKDNGGVEEESKDESKDEDKDKERKEFIDYYLDVLKLPIYEFEHGVQAMRSSFDIIVQILNNKKLRNTELEWSWPKGRALLGEDPYRSAKREFKEETEAVLPDPIRCSQGYFSSVFRAITGLSIESRYWLHIIQGEIELKPAINHPEVANRCWMSAEQLIPRFKPWQKTILKKLISNINLSQDYIDDKNGIEEGGEGVEGGEEGNEGEEDDKDGKDNGKKEIDVWEENS